MLDGFTCILVLLVVLCYVCILIVFMFYVSILWLVLFCSLKYKSAFLLDEPLASAFPAGSPYGRSPFVFERKS